ncbi:hypothetical protein O181_008999 [Austropuccinia psidii MF-1]|uniref:Tet-like 2OG-Fe(II) oxygenase domain-containing protein n=1 Tax=Austropuccinia psidii MF-1 TaxID=1389203 RepID=A0A9Q3GJE4_9BASI|nr:hypothetical protein [Austropuccinia psidii MF-1]
MMNQNSLSKRTHKDKCLNHSFCKNKGSYEEQEYHEEIEEGEISEEAEEGEIVEEAEEGEFIEKAPNNLKIKRIQVHNQLNNDNYRFYQDEKTKDLVCMIKFHSLEKTKDQNSVAFQLSNIIQDFHYMAQNCLHQKTNKFLIGGKMKCLGFRGGYDKGKSAGVYTLDKKCLSERKVTDEELWNKLPNYNSFLSYISYLFTKDGSTNNERLMKQWRLQSLENSEWNYKDKIKIGYYSQMYQSLIMIFITMLIVTTIQTILHMAYSVT